MVTTAAPGAVVAVAIVAGGPVVVAVGAAAADVDVNGGAAGVGAVVSRAAGVRAVVGAADLVVVAARVPTELEECPAELAPWANARTAVMIAIAPARTIFEVEWLDMDETP